MDLYILRHGIAMEPGTSGYPEDSERPLTAEGKGKMESIAAAIEKLELGIEAILSSPYVRTRQTAEIIAERVNLRKKLKFSDHLTCGGDPRKLFEEIKREYSPTKSLMLVGHEPYLSGLISMLLTGKGDSSVTMKKGGLCILSMDRPRYGKCACLEALLTPKQMIAMAGA